MSSLQPSRRIVFQGLGAVGVAAVLAGCGGGSDSSGGGDSGAEAEAGAVLVAASEVPVGGGVALLDAGVVVTQPTEGDFKAFSNTCTHTGTAIDQVEDGQMICPNHGSRFNVEDGSVEEGPATETLPTVEIKVEGDNIIKA